MKDMEVFVDDPRAPPVPRNFKVYQNEDGQFYTCSAPDTRKSKGRVPKTPAKFFLMENPEDGLLHWVIENEKPTIRFREFLMEQGLRSEIMFGMKLTAKAPKVSTILRQEYGMTGTPLSLYMQFCRFKRQKIHPKMAELALAAGELT